MPNVSSRYAPAPWQRTCLNDVRSAAIFDRSAPEAGATAATPAATAADLPPAPRLSGSSSRVDGAAAAAVALLELVGASANATISCSREDVGSKQSMNALI